MSTLLRTFLVRDKGGGCVRTAPAYRSEAPPSNKRPIKKSSNNLISVVHFEKLHNFTLKNISLWKVFFVFVLSSSAGLTGFRPLVRPGPQLTPRSMELIYCFSFFSKEKWKGMGITEGPQNFAYTCTVIFQDNCGIHKPDTLITTCILFMYDSPVGHFHRFFNDFFKSIRTAHQY